MLLDTDGFENISAGDTNNYGFKVPSMFINYFFWIEKQHTFAKKPQKKYFFLFIYLKLSYFLKNVRNSPDHANGVMSMH